MVKLKLTTWAEEKIKSGEQPITGIDPEVHLAFVQGLVDMGEGSSVVLAKDRNQLLVTRVTGWNLGWEDGKKTETPVTHVFAYDMKTWQVYNEPKRKKQ